VIGAVASFFIVKELSSSSDGDEGWDEQDPEQDMSADSTTSAPWSTQIVQFNPFRSPKYQEVSTQINADMPNYQSI
jgi:hypothetical protein